MTRVSKRKDSTRIELKTLEKYKGAVKRKTRFMLDEEKGCFQTRKEWLPLKADSRMPHEYRYRYPIKAGMTLLVFENDSGCDFIQERTSYEDGFPKDLERWSEDWNIRRRNAIAKAIKRKREAKKRRHVDRCIKAGRTLLDKPIRDTDLAVAGTFGTFDGARAKLRIDTVYVKPKDRMATVNLGRKGREVDVELPDVLVGHTTDRVVASLSRKNDGTYRVSGCKRLMNHHDEPFPDELGGLVGVSAEQLGCEALIDDEEEIGRSSVALLALTDADTPHHFELAACGLQRVFHGTPPRVLGDAPKPYDPTARASSCATATPSRAPRGGAPLLLFALLGALRIRRWGADRNR